MTLYDIDASLEELEALLVASGGEITPEMEEAYADLFAITREKLDAYAALIAEMEARAEVRTAEAKRLSVLAGRDHKAAARLRERMLWFFQQHGLKKEETARFTITLARHGGKAPLVIEVAPEDLPQQYQRVNIAPDTEAIRRALEAGQALPYARLGERGHSIRIR